MSEKDRNIALVHDWITDVGGDLMVLKQLHKRWPQAPIYCLYYEPKFCSIILPGAKIISSPLQKIYLKFKSNRLMSLLAPFVVSLFYLRDYKIVLSTGPAFAKAIICPPDVRHINYCYSPTRQFWDWQNEYARQCRWYSRAFNRLFQHFFRIWDRLVSIRADELIAISSCAAQRIKKYYRREASIVYPPVEIANCEPATTGDNNYYLIVSRLHKHKNVDLAVQVFNKLEMPLVVIGDGPELGKLKRLAGNSVKIMGYQRDEVKRYYLANCRAFVMPQEEDFGIAAVEALAYGKPVLALKKGGALDIISPEINGLFFDEPNEGVLADGVRRMENRYELFKPQEIRATAERFSAANFLRNIENSISINAAS